MNPETTAWAEELIPTRYSLLSRLKNWEDSQSWQVFFDTYWRLIYAMAIKSGLTGTEAEEVVQETMICLAKEIQKFQRDPQRGSFKGWLRHLTRWRIADQFRKRTGLERSDDPTAERRYQPLEEVPDLAEESYAEGWDQQWEANLVKVALERVKRRVREEQYQLFDLYVAKQWPVRRITETLGASAAQVYMAKHRITRLIRKEARRLEKEWNSP